MRTIGFFLLALVLAGSTAFAQNNDAEVKQYGTNLGIVTQTGDENDAWIYQGDPGAPVSNYKLPNYATDWIWGSWIDQLGNDNSAYTEVNNSSNATKIKQIGNENTGYQHINSYNSYTNANKPIAIFIKQTGNQNDGWQKTVASFGCYGIQDMKIYQDGVGNFARQYSKGGMQSVMKVIQNGNGNNYTPVDVSCTGQKNPLALPWADKPGGKYAQYQNGRYSEAIATVNGSNNNTAQYQEYTVWSISGKNDAYIDIDGDDNNAAQGQLGEENYADIDITGSSNVAAISQWGDLNSGTITVIGSSNCAGIEQKDNNNTGSVYQNGDGNKGLITQHPAGI
jgi:hypothetical protein